MISRRPHVGHGFWRECALDMVLSSRSSWPTRLAKNAAETIRGFWNRVAGWFVQAPGEMRATTEAGGPQPGSTDTAQKVASRGKEREEE